MAKTNITLHLAKAGMTPEDIIVGLSPARQKERHRTKEVPERKEIRGLGTLYYRKSWQHTPAWVTDFFDGAIDAEPFIASSASAALLVEVSGRLFAITFGQGRHLLETGVMEDRFGLKVVLNTCGKPSFRKVNSTSVAGNASKMSEQHPRLSELTDFGIDSVTDTLDSVTARAEDDDLFEGTMTGGDALAFSTDQNVRTIVGLLGRVLERYEDTSYKDTYPWVDNVVPVKDASIKKGLEDEVVRLINARDARIWTAPPVLIEDWGRIGHFHVPGCRERLYDVTVKDVLRAYTKGLSRFEQLRSKHVEVIDSHDGVSTLFKWRISQCLYGEFDYEGDVYCINAGKWYRVSRDYSKDVNDTYERAVVHDASTFPVCGKKTHEDDYNKLLAESKDSFLLMDKKTIRYGLANSSVELCDVLDGNDTFIHVKHYSGSATLSHLFSQGYNSAYLVRTDPKFVSKANEKIREQPNCEGHAIEAGKVARVVYAIICENPDFPPNIPFFSRITYNEMSRHLRGLGIKSEICAIRRVA
ncbi:MAG: TIGR04141 family sporadically distributed protein [Atopobiaceae bacterium]|nr:TIGR04141 family sporadically distributed protein [Atopobiaceae bacterium]